MSRISPAVASASVAALVVATIALAPLHRAGAEQARHHGILLRAVRPEEARRHAEGEDQRRAAHQRRATQQFSRHPGAGQQGAGQQYSHSQPELPRSGCRVPRSDLVPRRARELRPRTSPPSSATAAYIPFVALGTLAVIAVGSRYYSPYAFVDGPGPDACMGPTDDGQCELRMTEVPLEDGSSAAQCVSYCPQAGLSAVDKRKPRPR